jgi:hypothetical protein
MPQSSLSSGCTKVQMIARNYIIYIPNVSTSPYSHSHTITVTVMRNRFHDDYPLVFTVRSSINREID